MALDTNSATATYEAPMKDLYDLGEMPPLGHVPKQMHAWAIRRERHGEPDTAMQVEVVDTPQIDSHEVLVLVMASGPLWEFRFHPSMAIRPSITSPDRMLPGSSGRWVTR